MADVFKTIKVTQNSGGPLQQQLVGAISTTSGAADAGKVILTDATGQLDASFGGGGGGGSTVQVNGSIVTTPNFNGTDPAAPGGFTNVIWQVDGGNGNVSAYYATSGGSSAFSAITGSTNTTAAMVVGTGASLSFTGSGVVNASELNGVAMINTPSHIGQIPIVSNLSPLQMNYADPLIQGLYAAGSNISTPPAFATPTTIQPVLVGASDGTNLRNIASDTSGQVKVLVQNTPSVTVTSGSITVAGTVAATQSGSWNVGITGTVTVAGTVAATQSGTWNIGTVTTVSAVTTITNPVTVAQSTAANLNATVTGTVAATQSGTWNIGTLATITNAVTVAQPTAANLNATVTGTVAATQSGSWTVTANQGTSPWITQDAADGTTGSAVPAKAIYVAGNKSGNLTGLLLDSSGNLNVNVAAGSSGNAAASATGSTVPADADYQGINVGGTLRGVTGFSVGSQFAEAVAIVDGSGVQITSFGGGAQFAMGSVQSASALGTIALGYDGTNVRGLSTNTSGQLNVIFPSAQAVTLTSTTITGTVTVSGTVTANVGTTGGLALDATLTGGTQKAQVTDGTNVAAVKAASTAATSTDPALVVTTSGSTTAGACATTAVTSTSGSVLAANTARRECIITNQDVVTVYIGLGQTPTALAYHIVLKPCTVLNDGTGGSFVSDVWKGAINAIVSSTTGHVSVVELT